MDSKWVAVTGASGFVGGRIALYLMENGYKVLSLSRTAPQIPVDRHITADISDSVLMAQIVADIPSLQSVVHAAASREQDESAFTSNVLGTYNVLKFLGLRTKSICNLSSIIIIGVPERSIVCERHPIKPQSLYHLTKYQAELLCELPEFNALNIVTLRFASPIGVGMPKGLIVSTFIGKCLDNETINVNGKGERVMNYIDTRDIADAVLCTVRHNDVSGLFLLNGTSISNIDLARLCIDVTNSPSPIKFSGQDDSQDSHKWIIDGSKAEKELGFLSRIPLAQSLYDIAEDLR